MPPKAPNDGSIHNATSCTILQIKYKIPCDSIPSTEIDNFFSQKRRFHDLGLTFFAASPGRPETSIGTPPWTPLGDFHPLDLLSVPLAN